MLQPSALSAVGAPDPPAARHASPKGRQAGGAATSRYAFGNAAAICGVAQASPAAPSPSRCRDNLC